MQRTLEIRSRRTALADGIVAENGFEVLRIEELVLRAGVAKGTLFAHFKDKDELMDLRIGDRSAVLNRTPDPWHLAYTSWPQRRRHGFPCLAAVTQALSTTRSWSRPP